MVTPQINSLIRGSLFKDHTIHSFLRGNFRSFAEARDYVHKLGLKSLKEWKVYCKSDKKPSDIPSNPVSVYSTQWKTWGDWLGTGTVASFLREYWPFEKAREYARKLKLRSGKEWLGYCRSGKKHQNVPAYPDSAYRDEWKGWGDWLGTDRVANQRREYWPFEKAREYAQGLKLKSGGEWDEYCNSGKKPTWIPNDPAGPFSKNRSVFFHTDRALPDF